MRARSPCPAHTWSGELRGPALVPVANGNLMGLGARSEGEGGLFFLAARELQPGHKQSFVVGLGWTLLFAQRGGARVAPQGLTERSGQEGRGQRSGSAN